ncbi:peptidase m35 deuterolysin [Diplodia corticola]|uniref:deuterolysin n=1 Tax=Diplodia corticola TaxID=236234 RepID=A0A1J9QV13_9PEZI|nr:peptidase m35 deuterolysin [Diplodia corticola]OJD32830.1 peptidase m35 deuterolysin [Diplodia corticola]
MKLILQLCLLALATLAACTGQVNVTLSSVGRTVMEAIITNTGQCDLNLFNKATILGDAPIQKVFMLSQGVLLPFEGVRFSPPGPGNYTSGDFVHLSIGNSVVVYFDASEEYDLNAGGAFTVVAIGSIPYAEGNSTSLKGDAVAFTSNTLAIDIAPIVDGKILTARTKFHSLVTGVDVASSCENDLLDRVEAAIVGDGGCANQADAAVDDAELKDTSKQFKRYFHTDEQVHKDRVIARFQSIADQCEAIERGSIKFHCEDVLGFCYIKPSGWSAAYAFDDYNLICLCDPAHGFPALTQTCGDVDMTGIVIHELSHLRNIYDPPTRDYATLLSGGAADLEAMYAVENADTYRLYAQALALNCPLPPTPTFSTSWNQSATTTPCEK